MSFLCKLCGLTIDEIPEDSIRVGKLYRFDDGSHHLLRKLVARTGPRPRKRTPDREPPEPTPSTPPPVMGLGARNVPEYVEPDTPSPAIEADTDEARWGKQY